MPATAIGSKLVAGSIGLGRCGVASEGHRTRGGNYRRYGFSGTPSHAACDVVPRKQRNRRCRATKKMFVLRRTVKQSSTPYVLSKEMKNLAHSLVRWARNLTTETVAVWRSQEKNYFNTYNIMSSVIFFNKNPIGLAIAKKLHRV